MSFDTTFKTKKYKLSFRCFSEVHNHHQNVCFRNAFLSQEDIGSFVWLFNVFKEYMGCAIVTYEDPTMRTAIERPFPETVNRFCCWHITTKLPVKLGESEANKNR